MGVGVGVRVWMCGLCVDGVGLRRREVDKGTGEGGLGKEMKGCQRMK